MKTALLTLAIIATSTMSFTAQPKKDAAANQIASQLISALKDSSASTFNALIPDAKVLLELMQQNRSLYGAHLKEAQADFQRSFDNEVIPLLTKSFDSVLAEGNAQGIKWTNVKLEDVASVVAEKDFTISSITITFSSSSTMHKVFIPRAMYYKGRWSIIQGITLLQ